MHLKELIVLGELTEGVLDVNERVLKLPARHKTLILSHLMQGVWVSAPNPTWGELGLSVLTC